jgi:carbon-monoxide dehydrogenase large subunit
MALSEGIVYDGDGQLLTATLMDYGLPRADVLPPIDVEGHDSRSPLNPLGLKGTGEGSAGPPPAAIANAIADALAADGVEINEIPISRAFVARSAPR